MEGIMAEGKAYYKDYDVEIPETLSAYGYGDSPLTFVSLSDYNGMRKLQGMDSVDLLENNYRILYNKESPEGISNQRRGFLPVRAIELAALADGPR